MSGSRLEPLTAWRVKRAAYPRFRQALWILKIGLIADAAHFFGSAARIFTITPVFWRAVP